MVCPRTLAMAEITYFGKRTVVSTKPVQPGKYKALSVLDRLMDQNHLKMVYYYPCPGGRKIGEVSSKVRETLSEMLTCFPIVTGRLQRKSEEGEWMVKCNDAGIRVVEARATGSVDEWLKCVDKEKELKLVHWEDMFHKPYFWSTFYIQLTEFEEGGLAIGLSCTHLLADPICVSMFIKAWADSTLLGKMLFPPLFHPLPPRRLGNMNPNHKPYFHLINHYKSSLEKSTSSMNLNLTTLTLSFSDHMVRTCMTMARTNGPSNLSPFSTLAGLFWVCVSKVKGMKRELVDMSICLDMRKVLGLDKGFFGNCMVYNKVDAQELDGQNLSMAAKAIEEVVGKMESEGIMDLIEWLDENMDNFQPLMKGDELICASLEGIEPKLAMFEEGFRPIQVSYYVEPVIGMGQIFILPSPKGEDGPLSRVVMVTLPKEEIVKLCEDDLILSLSPSILMGMNNKC